MNSSTWTAIIIAAIGFLSTLSGVVLTQRWAGKIEARRWDRERSRQDELDRREDQTLAYERRKEVYVDFMRDYDRITRLFISFDQQKPSPEFFDKMWGSLTAVMVYGTTQAQEIAQQCSDVVGTLEKGWEKASEDADSTAEALLDLWYEFLEQARSDLNSDK